MLLCENFRFDSSVTGKVIDEFDTIFNSILLVHSIKRNILQMKKPTVQVFTLWSAFICKLIIMKVYAFKLLRYYL